MQKIIFLFLVCCGFTHVYSQVDFNDYHTLQCSGVVPDAFRLSASEKVNKRLAEGNLPMENDIDQLNYVTKLMYAYEILLQSGQVVSGDPVSMHMQTIAGKLLASDPEILNKLHFYTFKSDVVGIRISEFGDVYVSTGLVSQVINDAQLAFLLAHELAHFVAPPVQSSYTVTISEAEKFFTNSYSVGDEQKADKRAEEWMQKSGFSSAYNAAALDVLLYSFLPFEDMPVPAAYFVGDSLQLPLSLFPSTVTPIGLDEKAIRKKVEWAKLAQRKLALTGGGNEGIVYVTDAAEFAEIRTISRFECVRSQILEADPGKALYTIFLLEKEYPNSLFLKRMKALCWTSICAYIRTGESKKWLPDKLMWQGEISKVYTLLSQLPFEYSAAFTLNIIRNCRKEAGNDPELDAIFLYFSRFLGRGSDFHLKMYRKDPVTTAPEPESTTKVQRIQRSINGQLADSLRFIYSVASDVVADPVFIKQYTASHAEYLQQTSSSDSIQLLPRGKRKVALQQKKYDDLQIGMTNGIIFQPQVRHYSSLGLDQVRSELLEKNVLKAFLVAANSAGIELRIPGDSVTLKGVNERILLSARMNQIQRNRNILTFPADYQELSDLTKEYGTDKLLLSSTDNRYFVEVHEWVLGLAITVFPLPILLTTYLPTMLMTGNSTTFWMGVYDLHSGEKIASYSAVDNVPLNTYNLSSEIYIALRFLQKNPK